MEDDKFKKLVQNISLDEPPGSFTDNVMKIIETEEILSLDAALLSVLKKELLAEPSAGFSNNLMASIQPKANKITNPVSTKKIGLISLVVVLLILFLALINSRSNLNHLNHSYFSRSSLNLSGTTIGIIKIATAILPYLIPLSILLFMDYFFRARHRQLISSK